MLALCVALAASPHGAERAFVQPLSRLTARVTARPRLLHPTVPPRRALLVAMQATTRAAPSFLELLKFTVCAMPIYLSPTLLSLIDTAVVGQVSSVQLAALGPACAICDALTGLMVFISVGTTNAVSTTFGGGDKEGAKRAATVSVVCAFAIGCVVALGLSLSIGPIINRVALPAALASAATRTGGSAAAAAATTTLWASCETYVRIRALSFPAALVLMSAQASCPGTKDPDPIPDPDPYPYSKPNPEPGPNPNQASCLGAKDSASPTLATLLASVVNVVGDAVLVLGPLAMGIAGAAWATVGCQFVAAGMLLRTLVRKVSK